MKWAFLLAMLFGAPALAALLSSKPRLMVPTCFLFGVALFFLGPELWASPISWPVWPGYVRGIYVSFIDGVAVAMIASTSRTKIPLSLKAAFAVYCLGFIISTFSGHQAVMPSLFYGWQLFRTVVLFVAIARVTATVPKAAIALVAGMGTALMFEAIWVGYQFAKGIGRPGGSFNNSNYMGLSLDYVVFPAMALMLGTRRLLWPTLTIIASLVIAVLGGSRSTLGLVAAGIPLLIFLSIMQKQSARKYAFAAVTALLLLAATPVFIWGAHQRSEAALDSSDQMRSAMKLAARMIVADYPFGIGANGYVVFANSEGYNARAEVAWNVENRAVPVHNTYYLVAAEMGFIGLLGLVSLVSSLILLAIRLVRKPFHDDFGAIAPGLLVTMIVVSVHIAYEFVFMDALLHSFFAIEAGLLVGLTNWAAKNARAVRPSSPREIPEMRGGLPGVIASTMAPR